ncbi:alpha-hydroxy-acid oxidizing protein [Mesorhizobium sp. RP14(2022)]|uniref:Alpha-hydroxy-acid oxidizing protein n=1 Tax=Mesorhizobium liriopis TaxID=2953882 RepID=A0ABT1C6P4_9HYPH|nr:alpha-hydroxy acid oxidase [Mesorhizobium liriopis]MCO6050500.1 alpha-hydroxy-acid oxidizing protein [Mesorhizobium liriopis]
MDFLDFEEARQRARRRLPRGVFEYIDRGTEAETAIAENRRALDSARVVPRVLQGECKRDFSVRLFGREVHTPILVAPTAFAGLVRYRGDVALAKAAAAAGSIFCAATESVVSLEDIVREASGNTWFQLYLWERREDWEDLLDRAEALGIDVLVLTVDTPVFPKKVFNVRNGFGLPMRFGPRNVMDVMSRPVWAADVLGRSLRTGELPQFANYPASGRSSILGRHQQTVRHQPGLSWEHVRQVRSRWKGKLLLKGILSPEDARMAKDHGAEGIVVSSHGMRNFDATVAPIDQLPLVRDAVGDGLTILADSGVQRGSDVMKLLRAGADAVMLGRAMLYALAAGGQAGAERMFSILDQEMRAAAMFAGWSGTSRAWSQSR